MINLYHPDARKRPTVPLDAKKDLGETLYYVLAGSNPAAAERLAELCGASARTIKMVQKASSPAYDSTNFGSDYSGGFDLALSRFIANHSPRGAFETMKADMVESPLHGRFIISSAAIAGSEVSEGSPKPIRRIVTTELATEISKFSASVAVTDEAIKEAPTFVQRILADALPEAVNRAVDTFFLSKVQGEEVGESAGEPNPSWALVLNDLEELMRNVQVGERSRLYFLMQPRSCKYLSRLATENGISTVRYDGGSIFGIPIVVSQAMVSGRVSLADASGIAYADAGLELKSSDAPAVELLDNPTNASGPSMTATSMVSAFQAGFRVLLAEKRIAVRVLDFNAVATLGGTQWGIGSDSPAGI